MSKEIKRTFLLTGLLFFVSVLFTLLVKTVDVQIIGPKQSAVGLGGLNQFMFHLFGVNLLWYHITDFLGLAAIFVAVCFGILGLAQAIRRKSIKKVDKSILILGAFYVLVIVCYILFEIHIVNYRPILMNGQLEPSFPSSHTMVVYCIMVTAMTQFHRLVKNKTARRVLDALSIAVIGVTVIGRFISGVHWFTDIIGGLLIGSALILLYVCAVKLTESKKTVKTAFKE